MLNLEKEQEEKMRREIEEDRQKMLHEEKLEAERRQKRVSIIFIPGITVG